VDDLHALQLGADRAEVDALIGLHAAECAQLYIG
jgi:hypothetical protein